MTSSACLKVALLGAGTVGSEVLRLLEQQRDDLVQRIGGDYEVIGVAVRDTSIDRGPWVPKELLTTEAEELISRADIVIEVMGGIEPAGSYLLQALANGSSVVTANKALLANDGPALYEAADRAGVDLYYEAAVAGAIPILRPIRESLAGDEVRRVLGIVNGTTNYILDAMTRTGASYDEALAKAQELGYAEADPTADVEGLDAAAKASILGSLAFHSRLGLDDVDVTGITKVSARDIAAAEQMNRVVKLLSIAERVQLGDEEKISARVYPVMIPKSHPLASVDGAFNAVFVEADAAGSLMFYGQGAGGAPTASAVLGDFVTAARNRLAGSHGPGESRYAALKPVALSELNNRFYLSLEVLDRPGVLAAVAGTLSRHNISIATVRQELLPATMENPEAAAVDIVTHLAGEDAMAAALKDLAKDEAVADIRSLLRVEGE